MKGKPAPDGSERDIAPPKGDPGMRETDDHAMGETQRGEAQPVRDLDPGVDAEHITSPSQGVRPER